MGSIARLTMSKAVEQIAREMDGPRTLVDIAQEAARRSGRPYTGYTPRTVADALARLRFIVRCAPRVYAPVRVALDGKAFRVSLTLHEIQSRRLSKRRLEPFYSALEKPPVRTASGEELPTVYLNETTMHRIRERAVRAAARALQETPWLERYLGRIDPEKLAAEVWKRLSVSTLDSGFIDLTPLALERLLNGHGLGSAGLGEAGLGEAGAQTWSGWSGAGGLAAPEARAPMPDECVLDLILRWDRAAGQLTATVAWRLRGTSPDAPADQLLADFLASRLLPEHAVPLGSLLLEAYARFPEVGRTPGCPPLELVKEDPRIHITSGDEHRMDEVNIARPGISRRPQHPAAMDAYEDLAGRWQRELRARIRAHPHRVAEAWKQQRRRLGLSDTQLAGARGKVVPLRKPSNAALIDEWGQALEAQGVSEKVRSRKLRHLEAFVLYLEADYPRGPSHLLDVDETDLRSFFFWTYIRRYPNSRSDALSFTQDLRDFYRYQQRMGRIADARFAELTYGVRDLIVERLELYEQLRLLADEPDFDDLYHTLFIG